MAYIRWNYRRTNAGFGTITLERQSTEQQIASSHLSKDFGEDNSSSKYFRTLTIFRDDAFCNRCVQLGTNSFRVQNWTANIPRLMINGFHE
jgi:hypothetical protein